MKKQVDKIVCQYVFLARRSFLGSDSMTYSLPERLMEIER